MPTTGSQLSFPADGPTMAEAFVKFDQENPRVYVVLVALAREWVRKTGGRQVGVGMLYERARWQIAIETNDPEFKLNNNHRSYFARKIEAENPDLRGLFTHRRSSADEWAAQAYPEVA